LSGNTIDFNRTLTYSREYTLILRDYRVHPYIYPVAEWFYSYTFQSGIGWECSFREYRAILQDWGGNNRKTSAGHPEKGGGKRFSCLVANLIHQPHNIPVRIRILLLPFFALLLSTSPPPQLIGPLAEYGRWLHEPMDEIFRSGRRYQAIFMLRGWAGNSSAIDLLLTTARDRGQYASVRAYAVQALGSIGDPVVCPSFTQPAAERYGRRSP
jgi:hypothetical protein